MSRLTKIDKMTEEQRVSAVNGFMNATPEESFRPEVVALYLGVSLAQLQKLRCIGGGPCFCKPTGRTILYKKQDVLDWINQSRMKHTA